MTILLVEDDEDFRHGLAENLRDDGHRVLAYPRPNQVPLEQLEPIHLAITDYRMDRENGFAFANRLHRLWPKLPVILITAFSTAVLERAVADSGFISLLHKPLEYERMERLIADLTGYRPQ